MPLKLENASKRVGNRWYYRDVTLEAVDGEVFAVYGPNGSGKGELIRSFEDVEYVTDPGMTIFGRRLGGKPESTIDRSNRLITAIATSTRPLVLDEPFRGLDDGSIEVLASKMKEAAGERNIPVLFSTSNFSHVLLAAHRALVIADGQVHQIGTPQALYDEPENRTTARLTGRNNLIEARRLTSSKSELPEFITIRGEHRLFTQKVELRTLGAINKNSFLAIRPEQISLSFGASFPEDNLLRAVITGIDFQGATTVVSLTCGDLALEALVMRLVGLNVGDECMVGLPPDRIRVLAA